MRRFRSLICIRRSATGPTTWDCGALISESAPRVKQHLGEYRITRRVYTGREPPAHRASQDLELGEPSAGARRSGVDGAAADCSRSGGLAAAGRCAPSSLRSPAAGPLSNASPETISLPSPSRGGAVLASLADILMPQAYDKSGPLVASSTTAGLVDGGGHRPTEPPFQPVRFILPGRLYCLPPVMRPVRQLVALSRSGRFHRPADCKINCVVANSRSRINRGVSSRRGHTSSARHTRKSSLVIPKRTFLGAPGQDWPRRVGELGAARTVCSGHPARDEL